MLMHDCGRRWLVTLACIAAIAGPSAPAQPQDLPAYWVVEQGLTSQRVVGLLDLPEFYGPPCESVTPKEFELRDRPNAAGTRVAALFLSLIGRNLGKDPCITEDLMVRSVPGGAAKRMPTSETGYEIPGLVVYERSGRRWFRVAMPRRSAWIEHDPVAFKPYPEYLLRDQLTYLRDGFDGRLWAAPDPGAAVRRIGPDWTRLLGDRLPIDVLAIRRVSGETWLEVRLQSSSCGETEPSLTPIVGWIPAYRTTGLTSAWFYSRGC